MSRFDYLNSNLNTRDTDTSKSLTASYAQSHPFIHQVMDIFHDYYEEILKPRTKLLPVFHKKEPDNGNLKGTIKPALFIYSLNFILPENEWKIKVKPGDSDDFATPGDLPTLSWHPNVSAQFRIELIDQYNNKKKQYANILQPVITFRTWGSIKAPDGSVLITQTNTGSFFKFKEHIQIATSIDGGWDQSATIITIKLTDKNMNDIDKTIEAALAIITPSILQHALI